MQNAMKGQKHIRFTKRLSKVLNLAHQEANYHQHTAIGTEHLLVGIILEQDGLAATILHDMNVNDLSLLDNLERITAWRSQAGLITPHILLQRIALWIGFRHRDKEWDAIGLTSGAKKSIELAAGEALRLGHNFIGTEHLLFGLVSEGEGLAAKVLSSFDVNPEKIRQQIVEHISTVK